MNKDLLEKGPPMPDTINEEKSYQRYQELGGIINEKDYESALTKAEDIIVPREATILQAESMAKFAGIELRNTENAIDKRIILYWTLRNIKPKEVMDSDWRLFRETLRILEDTNALNKLKTACHTNRPLGTYCPLCGQTKYGENCP